MAKKAVVEGEIVLRDGNKTTIEFFDNEVFILDDVVTDAAQARQIIKKGLLSERFRKIDNFKRVRTAQVVSFERTDEIAESSDLDKLLIEATKLNCIPENLQNYKRPDHKAKALQKAIDSAKARAQKKPAKDDVIDEGYVD